LVEFEESQICTRPLSERPTSEQQRFFKRTFRIFNLLRFFLIGIDDIITHMSDLDGVIDFLRRGRLDATPETQCKESAPNPTFENIGLRDLQASGGAVANDDETSSCRSAALSAAPTISSLERGDERRVVKYVPR